MEYSEAFGLVAGLGARRYSWTTARAARRPRGGSGEGET